MAQYVLNVPQGTKRRKTIEDWFNKHLVELKNTVEHGEIKQIKFHHGKAEYDRENVLKVNIGYNVNPNSAEHEMRKEISEFIHETNGWASEITKEDLK